MQKKRYSKLTPLMERLEKKGRGSAHGEGECVLSRLKENINAQRLLAQWQEVLRSEQEVLLMQLGN